MSISTPEAPPITTLADLVRTQREAKGLARAKLGELTGTSLSSMNRLELRNVCPLAPSLFRIARVLELDLQTVEQLVEGCANATSVPDAAESV